MDALDKFVQRRTAERLAARIIPEHAASMKAERAQKPEPPKEIKREEPTQQKLYPAMSGLQPGPDGNRKSFQVPRSNARPAQPNPVAAAKVEPPARKMDALDRFKAMRPQPKIERPAETLGRKVKLGMSM